MSRRVTPFLPDLANGRVLDEAARELSVCLTDADYAKWAKGYADAAIRALEDFVRKSGW